MKGRRNPLPFVLGIGLVLLIACSRISTPSTPEPSPSPEVILPTPVLQPSPVQTQVTGFGPIIFCEGVSEAGVPLHPSNHFEAGTNLVWAFFPYVNIQSGQSWGRSWEREGKAFSESREQSWQGQNSGWVAYAISGEAALNGSYSFTLFLDGEPVQQASFEVERAQPESLGSHATFGNILFAKDVTADQIPIGISREFEGIVPAIQAVFLYKNIEASQDWGREWLFNGETVVQKALVWNEARDGVTSFTFTEEDGQLDPGRYQLNLSIDGEAARSASFEVIGDFQDKPSKMPASPHDIIAPDLLEAWDFLVNSGQEILRDLADYVYKNRIRISLSERLDTKAAYQYGGGECTQLDSQAGEILIGKNYWSEHSPEEVASTISQQLAYAVWYLENGGCSCSIEREFYAFMVKFYLLEEMDRLDLLEGKLAGIKGEGGGIDGEKLWSSLKAAYPECPDF